MVIVGVCGGIAAYKTCELVRLLVRAGIEVQVAQTPDALRFVGAATFAGLSRRPVLTDEAPDVFPHLEASREAQLLCVAPLTATTLARLAHGEAANVLTATALAFTGPVVAAPAMNVRMWRAAATRANVELLLRRGVELVGPETGELAEGESGEGRMAEPQIIAAAVRRRLEAAGSLRGLRVCVSAGGTREPLDAVRYLSNRSSGRMGVAVADEAARRGADVTLVLAAASARPAAPMRLVRAESAAELEQAVAAEAGDADVVVMAAAVADYRPSTFVAGKRPKDRDVWQLALEPTSDILAGLGRQRRPGQTLVGFAAEHGADGVERAAAKRLRKNADMIVVNDVSRSDIGFDSDDNELTIVTAAGRQVVGKRSKRECAAAVWDAIAALRAGAGEPREGNRHARVTVGQGRERR